MFFQQQNSEDGFSGSPQKDRKLMIEQLRAEGITDQAVLDVMSRVPRHQFIDANHWDEAYANHPLPISEGQTISQPYIVARMTQSLAPTHSDRILEIGTGSGYQTAILSELAGEVYTIERFATLSREAQKRLEEGNFHKIHFKIGDGTLGWPHYSPFDAIMATGAVPEIPISLIDQLNDQGRIVIPVGNRQIQKLLLVTKNGTEIRKRELCYCSFLPLIGSEGWPEQLSTHNN